MNKSELLKYTGSMQQVADIRHVSYDDGRARGLKAVEVKNGPLRFTAMEDKCLDISELTYKGMQINFLSKPGLNGRNPFDTHGGEAQRSIMLGMFFTCGFENICGPWTSAEGKDYPMHGRMRTSPAEHVCAEAHWEGDDYVMSVSGDIREAELFGENLLLHRTIKTVYGKNEIEITDEVSNEAFRDEPKMQMYHINLGFPFLTEKTRLIIPSVKVTPRDDISSAHTDRWNVMDAPKDNEDEYVFIHELKADAEGNTFAAAVDDERKIAFRVSFNRKELPYFMEWKSTASGDYVIGLEPSNSLVYGRQFHEKRGDLAMIKKQSIEVTHLTFTVLEGEDEIRALEEECERLLK